MRSEREASLPTPFGVILAGGQARRLGGVDKALIEIGGQTILARLISRLAPQCAGLAINANGDGSRFSKYGLPVIADGVAAFKGPLAGVLAGLDYAAQTRPHIEHVVTAPADTPFVPRDLVCLMQQVVSWRECEIAVARSDNREHHAVALWPVSVRHELRRALMEEDLRKMSAFIDRFNSGVADWPIAPYDPFFNINTPEDVQVAERIAQMTETSAPSR